MYSLPAERDTNWEIAGVWVGASKGIPEYTVGITCTSDNGYAVYPGSVTNSAAGINAAIQACPAGYAVYLPEGDYTVTANISLKSGVALRGAGAGKTRILCSTSMAQVISIYGSYLATPRSAITSGYTKGSSALVVSAAASFTAGDIVVIDELNPPADDPDMPVSIGATDPCTWCGFDGEGGARAVMETGVISSIAGTTINLVNPQHLTRLASLSPRITRLTAASGVVTNAGVEYLSVVISGAPTGTRAIRARYCKYCWVRDCEITGMTRDGIDIDWGCYGFEARKNYVHHSGGSGAGSGYGIRLEGGPTNCLIEDNIFDYTHGNIVNNFGAGYVMGYNYAYSVMYDATWLQVSIGDHSAHPYLYLSEGNIVSQIHCDDFHGSASHNTYFRNQSTVIDNRITATQNRCAIELDKWHTKFSIIGNVFGTPSFSGTYERNPALGNTSVCIRLLGNTCCNWTSGEIDSTVRSTSIWHGNYDYADSEVKWATGEDTDLPDSLYLTSKPSWFGTLEWPNIGPDVDGYVKSNPAKWRWDQYLATSDFDYLFTDDIGDITGFLHTQLTKLTIGTPEQAKLYVDVAKKRAVVGDSVVYNVHAEPYNDFTGDITLDVSGLPTNATDAYSTNPITETGSSSVTVTTVNVAAGTYNMNITGTSAGGTVASVRVILDIVESADADIKVPFRHIRAKKGDNAVFTIDADSLPGYTGDVDLSVSGTPSGASASFGTTPIAYNGTTTLTIDTGTAEVGTYELTITGEGPA